MPRPLPDFLENVPFEDLLWSLQLDQRGVKVCLPEPGCERYEFRDEEGRVFAHWWDETGVTITQKGVLGPLCKHEDIVAWVLSVKGVKAP